MSVTSHRFQPIYAVKEKILLNQISNGTFYIASDTGDMYFDVNNERISLASNNIVFLETSSAKDLIQTPENKFYLTLDSRNVILL